MAIEKKSKSWGPFLSHQLDSSANPAHLPQKWAKWAELAVLFSWQLQNGPQDFDFFSIAMGADFSFYVKSIATYAPAFLMYNNSVLARVSWMFVNKLKKFHHFVLTHSNSLYICLQDRRIISFSVVNITEKLQLLMVRKLF